MNDNNIVYLFIYVFFVYIFFFCLCLTPNWLNIINYSRSEEDCVAWRARLRVVQFCVAVFIRKP